MGDASEDREVVFAAEGGCFGCSNQNPAGLQLRFFRRGDSVRTEYAIPDRFHGAPGIAHGGIVATILDEVSCVTVFSVRGSFVMTGELNVRYELPCFVERPLVASAWIKDERPRYLVVEAELRDGDTLVARSTGRFFPAARPESAP